MKNVNEIFHPDFKMTNSTPPPQRKEMCVYICEDHSENHTSCFLCLPTISETNISGMAVEGEPSHQ